MKFLLEVQVDLPADMSIDDRVELHERELQRGHELVRAGLIEQIWRVPGALRNVAIWEASDATELHEAVSSLPMFPWMKCTVTALATHPLQRSEDGRDG